ncbi:classical arabinogalactan protein 27-like [Lycium ferocissimum]|uniref:classical arabinogalactan protein 27-like n=1 Tax=Lycium ferocissimum TaxID=112874 RepID=UPI0028151EB9|nr:classical arabinogalactan protein 27-like [Lycium ferocissimum]
MASSFCFLVVATLIMAIFISTPLVVSLSVEMKVISSTPVEFLANPPVPVPVASPFSEISPDIAPLLPSSGGVVPPVSSVPTIPSNPSKNPDDMMYPIGPDSAALAPSAFSPISSAVFCVSLTTYLNIAVFLVVGLFCSI